jgi:hypothetical protein
VWEFLVITLLSGEEAHLAPSHITSIIEARQADDPSKHFTDKVRCIIYIDNGRQYTTSEECDSIEARLNKMAKKRIEQMRDKSNEDTDK